MNFDELENEALRLPVEGRARLADRLIKSLDDEGDGSSEEDVARAWNEEVERRARDLDTHPDQAIPFDVVLRRLRKLVD